jgi:hypothetical protein
MLRSREYRVFVTGTDSHSSKLFGIFTWSQYGVSDETLSSSPRK